MTPRQAAVLVGRYVIVAVFGAVTGLFFAALLSSCGACPVDTETTPGTTSATSTESTTSGTTGGAECPVPLDWQTCGLAAQGIDVPGRCAATMANSVPCFWLSGTQCGQPCGYPLVGSAYVTNIACDGQATPVEWWCTKNTCPAPP